MKIDTNLWERHVRIETKQELLNYLDHRGACVEARAWVRAFRSNKAEDIWLAAPKLEWVCWLLYDKVFPKKTMKNLYWHLVQTCLDTLGADLVQEYDLNRPLARHRQQRVYDNLGTVPYTGNQAKEDALDMLSGVLRDMDIHCEYFGVVAGGNKSLAAKYLEDIRHVISWEDVCKVL